MKTRKILIYLLFFSFLLVSCENAQSSYEKGDYHHVLELLNRKTSLTKDDYLLKIKAYVNLGQYEESKDSVMLYLLMANDSDAERSTVVDLFMDLDFSDVLNILILKDSDGLEAQIRRYISYVNLNDLESAKRILSDYLSSQLSINDFATLLVAYPLESEYVTSFFKAWYKTCTNEEKRLYYSLFFYYTKTNISEDAARECLELTSAFDNDNFFKDSQINSALLYKCKGYLYEKISDIDNALINFTKSYSLNPEDIEVGNKLK